MIHESCIVGKRKFRFLHLSKVIFMCFSLFLTILLAKNRNSTRLFFFKTAKFYLIPTIKIQQLLTAQ